MLKKTISSYQEVQAKFFNNQFDPAPKKSLSGQKIEKTGQFVHTIFVRRDKCTQ